MSVRETPRLRVESVEIVMDGGRLVLVTHCCDQVQPWKIWTIIQEVSGAVIDVIQGPDLPEPGPPPPKRSPTPRQSFPEVEALIASRRAPKE